jgi:biotin-(acetyl-CoA carboxylase) ligase
MKHVPTFPPLLKGHRIAEGKSAVRRAKAMIEKEELGAGDLLWVEDKNNLQYCVILEPEVSRARCSEILFLMMVAFGDALGALAPPEMAVTYKWPNDIQLNDASIGYCELELSNEEIGGIPLWMIISIQIDIKPENILHDPGNEAWRTTLWEEGCGNISQTELLESSARHFLNWMHTWDEEGFKPVHDQWMGRVCEKEKLLPGLTPGELVGLDEHGNALAKSGDVVTVLDVVDALAVVNSQRATG